EERCSLAVLASRAVELLNLHSTGIRWRFVFKDNAHGGCLTRMHNYLSWSLVQLEPERSFGLCELTCAWNKAGNRCLPGGIRTEIGISRIGQREARTLQRQSNRIDGL